MSGDAKPVTMVSVTMDAYDSVTLELQRLAALCEQLGDRPDDDRLSCVFSMLADHIDRQRDTLIEGIK